MFTKLSAQKVKIDTPYFKVLSTEKLDIKNSYNYKDFYFSEIFKVGNEECKKVRFRNKYGVYNMTQNKWVVNIQYKSANYVSDSLFRLRYFERNARLMHLDANSIYNIEGEFEIELNKDGLLQPGIKP